jgi:RHH-type proline utilization regulon transcriptional repressor/proline dehydrogenase/delta 1-pyrroline-5-carboxylate dehydrogenase
LVDYLREYWEGSISVIEENNDQLVDAMCSGKVARLRYAGPNQVPLQIRVAAAKHLQYIADAPVSMQGRIELLWYLREQSISYSYHRYGNLNERSDEARDIPA